MSLWPLWNVAIAGGWCGGGWGGGNGGGETFLYIPRRYIHCSSCPHARTHARRLQPSALSLGATLERASPPPHTHPPAAIGCVRESRVCCCGGVGVRGPLVKLQRKMCEWGEGAAPTNVWGVSRPKGSSLASDAHVRNTRTRNGYCKAGGLGLIV